MNLNLYTVKSEYLQALEHLKSCDELTPEMIQDSLAALQFNVEDRVINLASYMQNLEAEVLAMKDYEFKMSLRRKRTERIIEQIKDHIKSSLIECSIKKVKGNEFSLTVSDGGFSVEIENESKLPDKFLIQKVTKVIDKASIKDALTGGQEIEGAKLKAITKLIIR